MVLHSGFSVGLFSNAILVAAAASELRVHERRTTVPIGYTAVGKADPHTPLTLALVLTPRNEDGLIDQLYAVSDPSSADYGNHLSLDQVADFMAPPPDALSAVTRWLSDNGATPARASLAGDWLKFSMPAAQADTLFYANFTVFAHAATNARVVRTLQYSLPPPLRPHIRLLFPGVSFGNPHAPPRYSVVRPRERSADASPASCEDMVTPACVQALYGVPTAPATQPSNVLAITGFNEQYASQADLTQFLTQYRPDIANATFTTVLVDGGQNPQDGDSAGTEANMDMQYAVGIATGVPVSFVSVGPTNGDSLFGFLDVVLYLLQLDNPPQVISTSYLFDERDNSPQLFEALCAVYAMLGARGTSIVFATGDGGVAGKEVQECEDFIPTFPASCPFVTAVGATAGIAETGADFSTGGFSNLFPRPTYQAGAVAAYLDNIGPLYAGRFNATSRAFPDVAATGTDVVVVWLGIEIQLSGTSASAPIFASMIALINDRRAELGSPPLGFLNPFLYANPQAFTDITVGSNPGCGTAGFPARAGWDPVTGLGTPIFEALAAAAGA
ncbi:family S53 protease-like protein [Auricularia subglabra TFB-10046 SS5]|nr:family S53 protease-like protein [Auricularia subglabra TFB-10046 SS5]